MKLKKKEAIFPEPDDDNDSDDDGIDDDFENDGLDDYDLSFDEDSASPPMEKRKDLLLKLTDFQPYLKTQIMEWLGMYWDDEKGMYVKDPNLRPMMNIQGARWGVNFLRTYTRDNNIITNFEEKEYKSIMRCVIEVSHYIPAVRAEEFDLKNDSDILTFANQLTHSASLILLGAGGKHAYTSLLQTAVTRHENVNVSDISPDRGQSMIPRKKGFMDNIKNYFGGG